MKKSPPLWCLAIIALSNAHAEDRLFPTDILNKGEIDSRFTLTHDNPSGNFNSNGYRGRSSTEITRETLAVRYGLGSNWHVGLTLPYASRYESKTDFNDIPVHSSSTNNQGWQNPTISVTYGLINDRISPFTLNASLAIIPDTTGKAKTTEYTGSLISGWKKSETLNLYAGLSATTPDDPNQARSYSIDGGAYVAVSENLTLVPHAIYVQYASTNTFSSHDQIDVGLSANVRFAANFYLIPNVVFYRNSSAHSNDGYFQRDANNNNKALSLSAYYRF